MKVYFVHSGKYLEALRKAEIGRVMVSYGLPIVRKNFSHLVEGFDEVMIDSGGYQLQKGREDRNINVENYADWLKLKVFNSKHKNKVVGYMNLDVFENGEETFRNQKRLESVGLNPIPVWHDGDDVKLLDYYCGSEYEVVALGGFVSRHFSLKKFVELLPWYKMRYPKQKFHLLGLGLNLVTALGLLEPYSVDISTWLVPAKFGQRIVWDERRKNIKEANPNKEFRDKLRGNREKVNELLIEALTLLKQLENLKPKDYAQAHLFPDRLLDKMSEESFTSLLESAAAVSKAVAPEVKKDYKELWEEEFGKIYDRNPNN